MLQKYIDKLWTLQSAILALIGLGDALPAAVNYYLGHLLDIINLDIFHASEMSELIFGFTETGPVSLSMEQAGMDSTNCVINSSSLFYIMLLLLPVYILIATMITKNNCKYTRPLAQWIAKKLKKPFSYVNRWNKTLEMLYTA